MIEVTYPADETKVYFLFIFYSLNVTIRKFKIIHVAFIAVQAFSLVAAGRLLIAVASLVVGL